MMIEMPCDWNVQFEWPFEWQRRVCISPGKREHCVLA
jgi:hypothetical protein